MADAYKDLAADFVRRVSAQTGKTPSALAALIGKSSTTFTRPLNDPQYKHAIKFETLRLLSAATGIPLPVELQGAAPQLPAIASLEPLPVRGVVSAGFWQEVDLLQEQPLGVAPMMPDPRYSGFRQWAELVRGNSMDRHYQDGDYVHVVSAEELGYQPIPGDHVIAERFRNGEVERTCKQVVMAGGQLGLAGDSRDEIWNRPLPLDAGEGTVVQISGLVIGSYRPRRR